MARTIRSNPPPELAIHLGFLQPEDERITQIVQNDKEIEKEEGDQWGYIGNMDRYRRQNTKNTIGLTDETGDGARRELDKIFTFKYKKRNQTVSFK